MQISPTQVAQRENNEGLTQQNMPDSEPPDVCDTPAHKRADFVAKGNNKDKGKTNLMNSKEEGSQEALMGESRLSTVPRRQLAPSVAVETSQACLKEVQTTLTTLHKKTQPSHIHA